MMQGQAAPACEKDLRAFEVEREPLRVDVEIERRALGAQQWQHRELESSPQLWIVMDPSGARNTGPKECCARESDVPECSWWCLPTISINTPHTHTCTCQTNTNTTPYTFIVHTPHKQEHNAHNKVTQEHTPHTQNTQHTTDSSPSLRA